MKNVFVIPTNNPSRLYGILGSYRLGLTSSDPFYTENFGGGTQNQNIYITSDEEVKDGEYGVCANLVREGYNSFHATFKMDSEQRQAMEELGGQQKAEVLKIVLTTDQDLIKDGVQPIPDEFLLWFVDKTNDSGKSIDIVEIDKVGLVSDNGRVLYGVKYKIIIPKEEPKCTCKVGEPYNNACCKVHGSVPKEESKQDLEKEMFELEQELDIPSNLRWHNSKPKQETELDAYYGNGIGSVPKEMLQEIENQVKLTESRGEKIVKYLEIFKGQPIYNDIALAIEFGYQLRLEEEKDGTT
jgi:hypothetical protein